MDTPVFKIRNDLIEAYKGYYEDELERINRPIYDDHVKEEVARGAIAVESYESWLANVVRITIVNDSPKERLRVYCEWNGILGYSTTLFDIATGKLS